jgi:pseudouridine kinase
MIETIFHQRTGPVLVIGGAGIDIVGSVRGELRPGTSLPGQIRSSFGGVARNVAENLARLGCTPVLVTAIGDDDEGRRLVEGLETTGVDTRHILRDEKNPTGSYLAIINASGELQFALDDMRVINAVTPEYILEVQTLFKQAALVFVDGNLSKETLRCVMSVARKEHLPVCADPTSAALAARFIKYLSYITLATPNQAEAAIICECEQMVSGRRQANQAAKTMVARGVEIAIITLADKGLCYATSESSGYIPAIRTTIVDPTGAGDALSATVIFALLNEIPLDDAVRLGVSAASLTLGSRGAVSSELSLEKLYDRLVI